ncbi:MAG: hypothetical protein AAF135_13745 [Bacteroidota bacterium]
MQKLKSRFGFIKCALFFFSIFGTSIALLPAQFSMEYVSGSPYSNSSGYFKQNYDIFQINSDGNNADATLRLKAGSGSRKRVWTIVNDKETRELSFNYFSTTNDNDMSRAGYKRMVIQNTGVVNIFTRLVIGLNFNPSNSFKLAVDGAIGCKTGIKVIPAGENFPSSWPDYVFAEDYDIRDLSEVEAFIKENKHLPDVPSEAEVNSEGIELVEMNATLLKKIEELTLYVIDQNKQIIEQNERIEALEQSSKKRK